MYICACNDLHVCFYIYIYIYAFTCVYVHVYVRVYVHTLVYRLQHLEQIAILAQAVANDLSLLQAVLLAIKPVLVRRSGAASSRRAVGRRYHGQLEPQGHEIWSLVAAPLERQDGTELDNSRNDSSEAVVAI